MTWRADGWSAEEHDTRRSEILEVLRNGLIVSCQAPLTDPASGPAIMAAMAGSVVASGAVGVRAEGLEDIRAIRAAVGVPMIGLLKVGRGDIYITPTLSDALEIAGLGVELVAIDGSLQRRPDSLTLRETIEGIHGATHCLVLADVANSEEGLAAEEAGADVIATTMSGYRAGGTDSEGPDLQLVRELVARVATPVIAEGRISTPAQARRALDEGAWAVVVGTSITRPGVIARRFVEAVGHD